MSDIKIPVVVESVVEVRIVPATGCYVIEVVYEKTEQQRIESKYVAGIDLGIDRLVALATNKPGVKPLLINGKPLKSVNQLYNKRKAKYQTHLKGRIFLPNYALKMRSMHEHQELKTMYFFNT
ncbi:MAG: transposase [Okeania sp. SIO3B5]|uniref:transposase n=1 Tax=Okeania sp. SIO3B5 TaxID=2607811 RepID=UPI0013FF147A|nr:transposase [Okeania sp. SIO3B5]NEO58498.1 transposase [Okeania sp. SIO3B5]